MEDYMLDLHFNDEKIKCTDEQAAKMATKAFIDTPKSIIKELSIRFTVYFYPSTLGGRNLVFKIQN